jgi:hypothetical protein
VLILVIPAPGSIIGSRPPGLHREILSQKNKTKQKTQTKTNKQKNPTKSKINEREKKSELKA